MTREELNEKLGKEVLKEEKSIKTKKIVKRTIKILLIIIVLSTLFFTYTTYISSVKIKVREYRIENKKVPQSFNGLKVVQFSDLHYGTTMFTDNLEDLVNKINERSPDLILFTGDLIDKDYNLTNKEEEKIISILKRLNSTLGKYAITGDEDKDTFNTILNQSNFTILNNSSELIYNNDNNPILLVGISNNENIDEAYSYFRSEVYNSNIYTITMLHKPDIVEDIKDKYPTDLYLAGHSNNGNIRIPIINYSPFKLDGARIYDQDYYKINNSSLYISSGLGTTNNSKIRLFCRPSFNFFRISS